jgi:hypothetical protein
MQIVENDLVVGCYSVLPYFRETASDIEFTGARLINGVREHSYIADMRNWAEHLSNLTPRTWYHLQDFLRESHEGSFVLKGRTNSRKDRWRTHMFAATQADVPEVYERLLADGLLGQAGESHQDIYIRKYVPFVTYARGIGGLPITKEFRFFVAKQQVLCGAFYWSSWGDMCLDQDPTWKEPAAGEVPVEFLQEVVARVGDHATYYTIDVGQDTAGRWWVVELNDGQMAGKSGNRHEVLYRRLYEVLSGQPPPTGLPQLAQGQLAMRP